MPQRLEQGAEASAPAHVTPTKMPTESFSFDSFLGMTRRRPVDRRPVERLATDHVTHGFVDVEFVVILRIAIAHAIETADGRVARREVAAAWRPNDDGFTHCGITSLSIRHLPRLSRVSVSANVLCGSSASAKIAKLLGNPMQYTTFAKTGMTVSRLCLGCMTYGGGELPPWALGTKGWHVNKEDAREHFALALESGINFFDTADVYSVGASEEITGFYLKEMASRDDVVVATKVHGVMGPGPNRKGLS